MKSETMVPPYLDQLAAILEERESALWSWCRQELQRPDAGDAARLELRKTTYPLDQKSHAEIYEVACQVATELGIDTVPTLYQAQEETRLNATLAPLTAAPHITLYGPVKDQLDAGEIQVLLAHELSHWLLWQMKQGVYQVAEEVLRTLCQQPQPHDAYINSFRIYRVYTEIFCDRNACSLAEDAGKVVSVLLKTTLDTEKGQVASALYQEEKWWEKEWVASANAEQTEVDVRARAVHMWWSQAEAADSQITAMIEGCPPLNSLDVLAQQRLQATTRRLIDQFMKYPRIRTKPLLTLCREYFPDYEVNTDEEGETVASIGEEDESVQQYFVYVLLDLATADPESDALPLAAALRLSKQLEIQEKFSAAALQEMRLRKRQLQQIHEQIDTLLG